jgi:hypothetical protein
MKITLEMDNLMGLSLGMSPISDYFDIILLLNYYRYETAQTSKNHFAAEQ